MITPTFRQFLAESIETMDRAGLKKWVEDYKAARAEKNVKLAQQLYKDIVAKFDSLKLSPEEQEEIWGEDPDKK